MSNKPSRPALPRIRAHWRELFHSLMPYRIREVLLVSSAYDAFLLEEDGPLTHRLFANFAELELSWAPRITHASTAEAALTLLHRRPFQLVVIATSLVGTDAVELGRQIRKLHPKLPLVLMVFDEAQLKAVDPALPQHFDQIFLWSGDSGILIAIVKLLEDSLNIEHDVDVADVQVVLVVEDSVRTYSTFLTLLYPELLRQSRSLIAEGVNEFHRLLRIHARPKIVLTRSFEDAVHAANRWQKNLMGVFSDVAFPRLGQLDPEAGIELARMLRARDDPPPVLLQSSDASMSEPAHELDVVFADKNSPDAMDTVRWFLQEHMGFGDFVFRRSDGTPVGGARSVSEMADALEHVPLDSILHHARRHDFSRWLKARSMFQIARHTRGVTIEDFRSPERIRGYLQDLLHEASDHDQAGAVTDMRSATRSPSNRFVRLGTGSIGGKARSIGFASALLVQEQLQNRHEEIEINIPKTVAISVAEYDRFVHETDFKALEHLDDPELRRRLLASPLSDAILSELRDVYSVFDGPVAVRSSSLREDARFQPFAGVYATYMLPNNHPDREVRFAELCRAIKAVYASMFTREARIYSAGHPHSAEDEKMAVVVQQLVGQRFEDRFYPHISGVAQSFNFYPVGPQRADEGLAVIALGLGQMVVAGGGGLRFSPAHPDVLPQFSGPRQVLECSQRQFYALDLSSPLVDLTADPAQLLRLYDLDVAEADGTLAVAGSVYSPDDNAIRENLTLAGPRVVTFANVLRWKAIPLAPALSELLVALRKAMSSEVEIEFAVDMGDFGRVPPPHRKAHTPRLYVLQARPMAGYQDEPCDVDLDSFGDDDVVVRSGKSLGNGRIDDVRDVVYVRRSDISAAESRAAARTLREMDHYLGEHGRRYLLVGPGRWGSSDAHLGIPVEWLHIANARVIVEMPLRGELLESSQGTHFFHNLTAARLGYLTATPETHGRVDISWLEERPAVRETELVRHVELDRPLAIYLDGRRGRAVVVKPKPSQ
jgi:CheY-like chemotaxis protein